jgi:hypothetical protein
MIDEAALRYGPRESYFRGPPRAQAKTGYKEWLHFCVAAPSITLLVNLSLMASARGSLQGRLAVLVHAAGQWTGGIEDVSPAELTIVSGLADCRFGGTRLATREGAFDLLLCPRSTPVSGRLRLTAASSPMVRSDTVLDGDLLSWLTLPRMHATGTVVVDGATHVLTDAPSYHDHNWGRWPWGSSYWQWGVSLPPNAREPWTAVFYRLIDRTQNVEKAHALLLWRGSALQKVFREGDVIITPAGFLPAAPLLRIPPVMGLVAPARATDVPARLTVNGRRGNDWVRCEIENSSVAQIVVPNETDLGVTIINEVVGSASLAGSIGGEGVTSAGPSMYEHVTGA